MFAVLALLAVPTADAHKPTFGPGYADADSALLLDDPDVSIVLYREITCDEPQVWITFDADPGYEAWVQLGVPEIERLADYRPALAVVAPGLPDADLPFALPAGTGAVVFETDQVDQPADFYEAFTQTSSWVLVEALVTLPEGGPAWVVAWDPEGWTGKLWVAVGTVEDFSDVSVEDFAGWSEQVHDFHETGRYDEPPDVVEQQCALDEADTGQAGAPASSGCRTAPPAGLLALLAGLAPVGARRRRR